MKKQACSFSRSSIVFFASVATIVLANDILIRRSMERNSEVTANLKGAHAAMCLMAQQTKMPENPAEPNPH